MRMKSFVITTIFTYSLVLSLKVNVSAYPATYQLRMERLISAGKLWGTLKYFHPYLAYKNIDWDSALIRTIPKINNAKTTDEYAKAVQEMLASLDDPVTRVLPAKAAATTEVLKKTTPFSYKTEDGILVITITRKDESLFRETVQQLRSLIKELPSVKGIIFDFRYGDFPEGVLSRSGFSNYLSSSTLDAPGKRYRVHRGFADQANVDGGGYSSTFVVSDSLRITPVNGAKDTPTVFIVNGAVSLPPLALALQSAGKGVVIAEGQVTDESVVTTQLISLGEGLSAKIRVSELVFQDGTSGFSPDIFIPTSELSEQANPALKRALEVVRSPLKTTSPKKNIPITGITNPDNPYKEMQYPPVEYRLLAAFRIWAVFNYFFPYRDLMEEDWNRIFAQYLPRFEAAQNAQEYALTITELVAHTHDSHVFVNSPVLREYFGTHQPPLMIRIIEDVAIVERILDETQTKQVGIEIGDVILKVDGESVENCRARIAKQHASSTPQALLSTIAFRLLQGPQNSVVSLVVRDRQNRVKDVQLTRSASSFSLPQKRRTGEIVKIIPGNIGYVDLDRLTVPMIDEMFEKLKDTKAIIFDMRGYPNSTAWWIAPRLTEKTGTITALFNWPIVSLSKEEGFSPVVYESNSQILLPTTKWRYKGKTVMLIDERAISQAEHTGLFFRAANGTKFIGTPTQGADGGATSFYVPGDINISFTGISVRHPDGQQLQRVGLIPDILVKPTIAGLRAGRDEILEQAIEYLNHN